MVRIHVVAILIGLTGVASALRADWITQRCLRSLSDETNSTIVKNEYCACICREARHPPVGNPPRDIEMEIPPSLAPEVAGRVPPVRNGRDLFHYICGRLCPPSVDDTQTTESDDTVALGEDSSESGTRPTPSESTNGVDGTTSDEIPSTEKSTVTDGLPKNRQKRSYYDYGYRNPYYGGGYYGGDYGYGGGYNDYYGRPYDPYYRPYYHGK